MQTGLKGIAAPIGVGNQFFRPKRIAGRARTAQEKLRDIVDARDFGVVGNGRVDDTAGIVAGLAALGAAGGGILEFPAGFNCRITSRINHIYAHVLMRGAGADTFHDAGSIAAATRFTWAGATDANDAMVLISSPFGITNKVLSGGGIEGIMLDAARIRGIGLQVLSRRQMVVRDIFVLDATNRAFWTNCGITSTDYGEAADIQDCVFERLRWRLTDAAAVQSAHGMYLAGSSNANTSFNTFVNCVGQTFNGTGFYFENADNNIFDGCRNFSLGSGLDFDLKGTTAGGLLGGTCNYFIGCSWGSGAGKFTVRGTEAGFVAGTVDNVLLTEDTANSVAEPVLGTGCLLRRPSRPLWTTYAPTFTSAGGTLGTQTLNRARYMLEGKRVHVVVDVSITSAGAAPSGAVRVTLPVVAANVACAGVVSGYESTGGNLLGGFVDGTNARATVTLTAGAFPGANGNRLMLGFTYEAA